jgi:WD40 repeat protein
VSVSKNKAYVYKFTKKINQDYSIEQDSYDDESQNMVIESKDSIIAICLSHDGRHLLCNVSMSKPRIESWDLDTGLCTKKYRGHQQKDYVLRPSFGGANERLVLCGSEDSLVYIWCRETTELLVKIAGHFQIVNSVNWHPKNPTLFVSASDDTRIKLWGLIEYPNAEVNTTKPKRVEYDPVTNTSFGALSVNGIMTSRPRDGAMAVNSSSDDFESSGEEIDEENDDEEGWGGLNDN